MIETVNRLELNETDCMAEARIFAFRYNLFYHIGTQSTLRGTGIGNDASLSHIG